MQALTLDHAKGLLRDSASVLDAALDSGLSGPGRLHDLFVTHEAMSPGEWKTGGAGMTLRYGFHPSPFGTAIVIASGRGLAGLAFADPGDEPVGVRRHEAALAERDLCRGPRRHRRPRAAHLRSKAVAAGPAAPRRLIGTDFEVRVWETLLKIPMGRARLFGHRQQDPKPEGLTRRRRRRRQESGLVRGAVPSRARQGRRADRLSLGHHAQAGDARLGSRTGRAALESEFRRMGRAQRNPSLLAHSHDGYRFAPPILRILRV